MSGSSIPQPELDLINDIAGFTKDPLGFVYYSFPWGQGELQGFDGPDVWQLWALTQIRDGLMTVDQVIRLAVASGHGIGKGTLVAWLILWGLSTCIDAKGVVTANTETQLKTKTWSELSKWYNLFIAKHWFSYTATAIYSVDAAHEKTWRVDMIPWSEQQTEAFAGLHNKGKRVMLFFDEASAIPDMIWDVSEGALTDSDTEIIWCVFGNPTRNTGRFKEAIEGKFRHRWNHLQVDSRTAKFTNKAQIAEWVVDYGEDSDFVKVRVRGQFPATSTGQFIPGEYVDAARKRKYRIDQISFAPVVLTLDNAWDGGDKIVITKRQGLFATILCKIPTNHDDLKIAGILARYEDEHKADAVFIDLGYGTGVWSAGKNMNRIWTLIAFGGASNDPGYLNKRVEMWKDMREWLRNGGAIDDDDELCTDLTGPEGYQVSSGKNMGKVVLESKKDMKARGLASPNCADGLALTFALPVQKKVGLEFSHHDYDPLRRQQTAAAEFSTHLYNPLARR